MTDDRTESEVYAGVMAECQLAGKGADLDAVIFECSGRAAATTSQEVEQVWDVDHHRDHDDRTTPTC